MPTTAYPHERLGCPIVLGLQPVVLLNDRRLLMTGILRASGIGRADCGFNRRDVFNWRLSAVGGDIVPFLIDFRKLLRRRLERRRLYAARRPRTFAANAETGAAPWLNFVAADMTASARQTGACISCMNLDPSNGNGRDCWPRPTILKSCAIRDLATSGCG